MNRKYKNEIKNEFNSIKVPDLILSMDGLENEMENGSDNRDQVIFTITKNVVMNNKKIFLKNVFAAAMAIIVFVGASFAIIQGFKKQSVVIPTIVPTVITSAPETTFSPTPSPSKTPTLTPTPINIGNVYESDMVVFEYNADITHDGIDEKIVVDYKMDAKHEMYVKVFKIDGNNEELIWVKDTGSARSGVYLYKKDNLSYLVGWRPRAEFGSADFNYSVSSLSEEGDEKYLFKDSIKFNYPPKDEKEVNKILEFHKGLKSYLMNSMVLSDENLGIRSTKDNIIVNTSYDDEWIQKYTIEQKITHYADLTHDGVDEKIVVDVSKYEDYWYPINVYAIESGKERLIWSDSAGTSHASANGIYLYKENNKYYLMEWLPWMGQGSARHSYEVFSLTSKGEKVVHAQDRTSFESPVQEFSYTDVSDVLEFCKNANSYLSKSMVLLDTDNGGLVYSTDQYPKVNTAYNEDWYWSTMGIDNKIQKKSIKTPPIVETVKKSLKRGMTKSDVIKLLGTRFIDTQRSVRYDLVCGDKYKPELYDDAIDYNGLKKGDVSVILFIHYDEKDKISSFSLIYTDDDKIGEYRVEHDGTVISKKHKI